MTVQDLRQLIVYWQEGSDYDWKTAQGLFRSRRFPYALFLGHLSLEKLLKGLIVKHSGDHAPFTHNLVFLAGKLPVEVSKERVSFLEEINSFNLEARYPDEKKALYKKATKEYTKRILDEIKGVRQWLKELY